MKLKRICLGEGNDPESWMDYWAENVILEVSLFFSAFKDEVFHIPLITQYVIDQFLGD